MKLYRIASRLFPIFDGTGAFLHGARWNSPGQRVIYASESLSCARLEVLVHAGRASPPTNHGFIEIAVPDNVGVDQVDLRDLPPMWNSVPDRRTARFVGDAWFKAGKTALLRVPSVASANDFNILINHDYPKVRRFVVSEAQEIAWYERLFKPPQSPAPL